jgi:hypothetical protein
VDLIVEFVGRMFNKESAFIPGVGQLLVVGCLHLLLDVLEAQQCLIPQGSHHHLLLCPELLLECSHVIRPHALEFFHL